MSWADKFNLLNPIVDLRLICALFFIPHVVGKFTEPATLGFFVAAKFNWDKADIRSHAPRMAIQIVVIMETRWASLYVF